MNPSQNILNGRYRKKSTTLEFEHNEYHCEFEHDSQYPRFESNKFQYEIRTHTKMGRDNGWKYVNISYRSINRLMRARQVECGRGSEYMFV